MAAQGEGHQDGGGQERKMQGERDGQFGNVVWCKGQDREIEDESDERSGSGGHRPTRGSRNLLAKRQPAGCGQEADEEHGAEGMAEQMQ